MFYCLFQYAILFYTLLSLYQNLISYLEHCLPWTLLNLILISYQSLTSNYHNYQLLLGNHSEAITLKLMNSPES